MVANHSPFSPSLLQHPARRPRSRPLNSRAVSGFGRELLASPANTSDLTDAEYQDLSDAAMDTMHENIESLCEDFGPETWEVEYSVSVLQFCLPSPAS